MAKIKITGSAMVVESSLTLEQMQQIEKHRPDAMQLTDGNGNVSFLVSANASMGSISKYGAGFASASRKEPALAEITMMIPADVTDAAEYAEDTIGAAIINLNKVEAQMVAAIPEITAEIAAIRANITVD